MTVDELIRELHMLPPTAIVVARIRHNVEFEDRAPLSELYEFRDAPVEGAVYDLGEVYLTLDENAERETKDTREAARGPWKL